MNQFEFKQIFSMAAIFILPLITSAGSPKDSTFKLVMTAGAGGSFYTAAMGTPSWMPAEESKIGPAVTFRIMWRPEHLLSVGLESGWTRLYSYETKGTIKGKVVRSQIPLFIVWSMKFWDVLNIFAGHGYSHLTTNLDYAGNVNAGTWSMGYMAACSYEYPLTKTVGIDTELKWINAVESHDAVLTLQIQFVYSLLEW